jgi:hypothetical protein
VQHANIADNSHRTAAVFVAEIGDVTRFDNPRRL